MNHPEKAAQILEDQLKWVRDNRDFRTATTDRIDRKKSNAKLHAWAIDSPMLHGVDTIITPKEGFFLHPSIYNGPLVHYTIDVKNLSIPSKPKNDDWDLIILALLVEKPGSWPNKPFLDDIENYLPNDYSGAVVTEHMVRRRINSLASRNLTMFIKREPGDERKGNPGASFVTHAGFLQYAGLLSQSISVEHADLHKE